VLRATSILPALKRRFPSSHITWITHPSSLALLENNPYIDQVTSYDFESLLNLKSIHFDIAYCIDKSLKASGVLQTLEYDLLYGFKADHLGSILPQNPEAKGYWELGLNDHQKFFVNKKPETQLITESLGLQYQRDEYVLSLTDSEKEEAQTRRTQWLKDKTLLVGINTGCSPTIKAKRLSVEKHRELIEVLTGQANVAVVLLGGGPEDDQRNAEIAQDFCVALSNTQSGLRDGMVSVESCDVIISGDSLGMHMGIALKKWVVAWFGPTCAHEIDFYDRGVSVLAPVECGPCWKRSCQKTTMCYDQVQVQQLMEGVHKGVQWLKKYSSFKPPTSEIFSSVFP